MKRWKGIHRKHVLLGFAVLLAFGTLGSWVVLATLPKHISYGFTFSTVRARQLGFDPHTLYEDALQDFQVERVRIPVYWNEVESEPYVRNYAELDALMNLSADEGVAVTLVIGQKVPRWPECFVPDWLETVSNKDEALLSFLQETVERYKEHPSLERWQVENESYFPFGECTKADPQLIRVETQLVGNLDPAHPVVRTASGEQQIWVLEAIPADVLGVSLYRVVEDQWLGRFRFPHRVWFYRFQYALARPFVSRVIVSELQAEPWLSEDQLIQGEFAEDLSAVFTGQDVRDATDFARQIGVSEVFFWGIEWWYYLKQHGAPELFETGQSIINDL